MSVSDLLSGFQNQCWRIFRYDGLTQVNEERIPWKDATESQVIARLEALARLNLAAAEIEASPHPFRVRKDFEHGNRLIALRPASR